MWEIDWPRLLRPTVSPIEVVLRASLVYGFLQLALRLIGRREMRHYSTTDVAVLFLVGTAMRKSIVVNDVSLTSAMIGLSTILGMDWLLSLLTFRSARMALWIEGPVRQLIREGELQHRVLRICRISEEELLSELRLRGHESLSSVRDAFLERSGRISFVLRH